MIISSLNQNDEHDKIRFILPGNQIKSISLENMSKKEDDEKLVKIAIQFLNNPKVVNAPEESKRQFLKKKGSFKKGIIFVQD